MSTQLAAPPSTARVGSVDLIRGAVMVLMAIDHVRVYSGLPAGGPTAGIFFTRWITHFVAPAFIFLAGTSAFFYGRKYADLSRFLLIRGIWLIVLELTVIRVAWTFNFDFANYLLAGVIWVIGWCMILMAALVRLRSKTLGIIGVGMILLHNGVMPWIVNNVSLGRVWPVVYGIGPVEGTPLLVLYSIIPWIGVMAAGYWFGTVLAMEPARRHRICLGVGLGGIALFLILRGTNVYGDPRSWTAMQMPRLLAFLNTSKYPASLSFLLMTLGPTIALIPVLERAHGRVARWLTVFGRVPFFYYLLHIPLIHALAVIVSLIRTGSADPWLFTNHPMAPGDLPQGYRWSLALLYLVWAIAIVLLYLPSRWYAELKARRTDIRWLKYL
jgi:uncharacterized membrane protein